MKLKSSGINWIGLIPEEWNIGRLKYAIKCLDYRRIPVDKNLRVDGPYPYWGAGKIMGYVDKYIFDEDIVLLGEDGAPFFDATRDVAHRVSYPCWVNNHIHVLTAATGFDNGFLKHYLNSVDYGSYINGSILNKLTQENMNNIALCYPGISEQRLIADFLDEKCAEIDRLSGDIQKQIDILNDYKKSVITRAVTKGLDPNIEMKDSDIEWCAKIPKHWLEKPNKYIMSKLKTICNHYNGEDILSLTMRGVIVRDLDGGGKMPTSFDGYQYLYPGNLLMCLFDYDVTPRCIGMIKENGLTSPAYSQFVLKDGNSQRYYYYYYLMIDYTKELLHLAKNLRHSFNEEQIGSIKAPVPPIEEQNRIADYLDNICAKIDNSIEGKESQLSKIAEYKKSIIYEYVTGKKRVA